MNGKEAMLRLAADAAEARGIRGSLGEGAIREIRWFITSDGQFCLKRHHEGPVTVCNDVTRPIFLELVHLEALYKLLHGWFGEDGNSVEAAPFVPGETETVYAAKQGE